MPWAEVVCDGCPVACRYADFRGPLSWSEADAAAWQRVRAARAAGDYRMTISRRMKLGILHGAKRAEWEQVTEQCAAAGGAEAAHERSHDVGAPWSHQQEADRACA